MQSKRIHKLNLLFQAFHPVFDLITHKVILSNQKNKQKNNNKVYEIKQSFLSEFQR